MTARPEHADGMERDRARSRLSLATFTIAALAIVATTGSTPQRVGAKMLVFPDGRLIGTIGGGCYENDAFWKAREAITNRKPQLVHYELDDDFAQETGLICGGQMSVYIEPIEPSPELYVIGVGLVHQKNLREFCRTIMSE